MKNDVNIPSKSNNKKTNKKGSFFVGILKVTDERARFSLGSECGSGSVSQRYPDPYRTKMSKIRNTDKTSKHYLPANLGAAIVGWRAIFSVKIQKNDNHQLISSFNVYFNNVLLLLQFCRVCPFIVYGTILSEDLPPRRTIEN